MFRYVLLVLFATAVTACATIEYNLPPVADATDGGRQPGKFIWHDLISDDPTGTEAFYGALFGWEFKRLALSGTAYWIISLDGEPIAGMVSQADVPAKRDISQWISVLSVGDPASAAAAVREAGGMVLREPVSLGQRGTIAVFTDAQGAVFAGLQTRMGDPQDADGVPAEGAFLWHELWTSDAAAATAFYAGLTGLTIDALPLTDASGAEVEVSILRDADIPRAGVRRAPLADMPSLWMPYLRVSSRARLDTLLADVPRLDGEVLVPATERPTGGYVAVIAGPSGAPIALQTWADGQKIKGTQHAD